MFVKSLYGSIKLISGENQSIFSLQMIYSLTKAENCPKMDKEKICVKCSLLIDKIWTINNQKIDNSFDNAAYEHWDAVKVGLILKQNMPFHQPYFSFTDLYVKCDDMYYLLIFFWHLTDDKIPFKGIFCHTWPQLTNSTQLQLIGWGH